MKQNGYKNSNKEYLYLPAKNVSQIIKNKTNKVVFVIRDQ